MDTTQFKEAVIRSGDIEDLIREAIGEDLSKEEIKTIVQLCAFYGQGSASEIAVDEALRHGASLGTAIGRGLGTFGPAHAPIVESHAYQAGDGKALHYGKVPGWGHPDLKWPNEDPRAKEILGWLKECPLIARMTSEVLSGKTSINVAGALAALAISRNIDPKRLLGLFIIARTIGLVKRALQS